MLSHMVGVCFIVDHKAASTALDEAFGLLPRRCILRRVCYLLIYVLFQERIFNEAVIDGELLRVHSNEDVIFMIK